MERVTLPGVKPDEREALSEALGIGRQVTLSWALAMVRTGKHFYRGTVPAKTVAKRRSRNRMARVSRRANRG